MELKFKLVKETKTCFAFESGKKPEFDTLYLKKSQVAEAGIDPKNGITVIVEETK